MKCVVLSSGGLDSTVTMAIAKDLGFEIISLSFDYGQRHKIELECAKKVAKFFKVSKHIIVDVPFDKIGASALTSLDIDVPQGDINRKDIPITYVPGRNIIFLSIAASVAESCGAGDIFIGVNAVDYSGYPDCRPEFIKQFENAINIGTKAAVEGKPFKIHTPLINLSKKEIVEKGFSLGVDFKITSSCYNPDKYGNPCGKCDSCLLRLKGFKDANLKDPLNYS